MFNVVISDLEHGANYSEVMAESWRVMKPGAVFLHIFPLRYRPIEPHIFVPCASFFVPRWWLKMWAQLGVRNTYQKGFKAREVVRVNEEFFATMTNYLTEKELVSSCSRGFRIQFVEQDFIHLTRRAKLLGIAGCSVLFGRDACSEFAFDVALAMLARVKFVGQAHQVLR